MRLAVWVGVAAIAGCSDRPAQGAAVRTDSAGVILVDNRTPLDGAVARYQVDSVPLVDIGGGTDPHSEFAPGIAVVRLQGRIIKA